MESKTKSGSSRLPCPLSLCDGSGKFWKGRSEWHVSCYPEDLTPERQEIIDRTNAHLAELRDAV